MIGVLWRRGPVWLFICGWLACVCGGAGAFYALLWWTIVERASIRPVVEIAAVLVAAGVVSCVIWHCLTRIRGRRRLYNPLSARALVTDSRDRCRGQEGNEA